MSKSNITIKKIVRFPERINDLSLFFIVLLYGLILFVIVNLSFPKTNYHIGLENLDYYPGETVYNSEINPFVLTRGTVVDKSESENEVELGIQYRIFAYIDAMGNNKPQQIKYFYSLTDKEYKTWFLYESTSGINTPSSSSPYRRVVSHSLIGNNLEVGGDVIRKIYMRLKYNNNDKNDQIMKISEEIMTLSKKERGSLFSDINTLDDILKVTLTLKNYDSSKYKTNFEITFLDEEIDMPYYIRMQTWLESEAGKVYPLLGLYNYRAPKDFKPAVETDIFKYVNPEFIYLKLEYIDSDMDVHKLYYKVSVADLLAE